MAHGFKWLRDILKHVRRASVRASRGGGFYVLRGSGVIGIKRKDGSLVMSMAFDLRRI